MNRNLLLVAVSLFVWGLGESLFVYFQPLYLEEWGADPLLIGSILGAVSLELALVQIPTGLLTDKFGSRLMMWLSWIIGAIAAWIMALAPTMPVFVAGLLLYWLTGFGAIPMNVYITQSRGSLSVGRALTFVSGMYNLGAVIGPLVGGLVADRLGFQTVYLISASILVISTIILIFTKKITEAHPADQSAQANTIKFYRQPRFIAFVGVIFVTVFFLYLPQPFTPSFLQNQQELTKSTIGLLGTIGNLGNALTTLFLGNLAPFLGLMIGQAWVATFAALFFWGKSPVWFAVGYFFLGGFKLFRSFTFAVARPMAHTNQTGLLFGAVETASSLAAISAPILAGYLYDQDPLSIYKIALIAIVIVFLFNLLFLRKLVGEKPQK